MWYALVHCSHVTISLDFDEDLHSTHSVLLLLSSNCAATTTLISNT